MSHKSSAALRNDGAGADFPGFGTSQGVDPASPPNLHETPTSTRPPFARDEVCEKYGLTREEIDFELGKQRPRHTGLCGSMDRPGSGLLQSAGLSQRGPDGRPGPPCGYRASIWPIGCATASWGKRTLCGFSRRWRWWSTDRMRAIRITATWRPVSTAVSRFKRRSIWFLPARRSRTGIRRGYCMRRGRRGRGSNAKC